MFITYGINRIQQEGIALVFHRKISNAINFKNFTMFNKEENHGRRYDDVFCNIYGPEFVEGVSSVNDP